MTAKHAGTLGTITGRGVSGIPVLPIAPLTGVPVFAPGGQTYLAKLLTIQPTNLIGLWPMGEKSGSVSVDESPEGNDGAYTGVTLNNSTGPTGEPVGLWDGANDFNNIYSAALNADFNNAELTVACWVKVVNAGVWTDTTLRYCMLIRADSNNRVVLFRTATNNQLALEYKAGGTAKQVAFTDAGGRTDWLHLAITASVAAGEVKAYLDGAQVGATLGTLGTWVGALNSTRNHIGAGSTTPTLVWSGYLAYGAVWTKALTPAEVSAVATV